MAAPYFWEEVPSVEVRGDMVFFADGHERQACMRMATARKLHRRMGAVLAMHDFPPPAVVPMGGKGGH